MRNFLDLDTSLYDMYIRRISSSSSSSSSISILKSTVILEWVDNWWLMWMLDAQIDAGWLLVDVDFGFGFGLES